MGVVVARMLHGVFIMLAHSASLFDLEGVVRELLRGLQVQPASVLVESVKDGLEDSLHDLRVGEQGHGPGAPGNFEEAGSAPGVNWVVTGPTPLVFV
jgi:hypothetical protein